MKKAINLSIIILFFCYSPSVAAEYSASVEISAERFRAYVEAPNGIVINYLKLEHPKGSIVLWGESIVVVDREGNIVKACGSDYYYPTVGVSANPELEDDLRKTAPNTKVYSSWQDISRLFVGFPSCADQKDRTKWYKYKIRFDFGGESRPIIAESDWMNIPDYVRNADFY